MKKSRIYKPQLRNEPKQGNEPFFSKAGRAGIFDLGNVQKKQAPFFPKSAEPALSNKKAPKELAGRSAEAPGKKGLPTNLRKGIEKLSGLFMGDVNVHYDSDKPAQVQALAYAQGKDIHLAPGQEKHLPHEAWHVVQQKQGRVKAGQKINGELVNEDKGLEKEADLMGLKTARSPLKNSLEESTVNRVKNNPRPEIQQKVIQRIISWAPTEDDKGFLKTQGVNSDVKSVRVVPEIKRRNPVEDRVTDYPPSLIAYALRCQRVAGEHMDAYRKIVDGVLNEAKISSASLGKQRISDLIRYHWTVKLQELPAATPSNPEAFSIDQIIDTLIQNLYTQASLFLNGTKVFESRNQTEEGNHAEDYIIAEFRKQVNWAKWEKMGLLTRNKADFGIIINNAPCWINKGCGAKLATLMKEIQRTFPKATLSVEFANPYELKEGGFASSIAAMKAAGINVATFKAANFLMAKKREIMNFFDPPMTEAAFNAHYAQRAKQDSAAQAGLERLSK